MEITKKAEYDILFIRKARALRLAHDIRKFEIDLYWKRATYFWTAIGVTFLGYFALLSAKKAQPDELFFTVACIGFLFSVAWFCVNKGSKYWQNNWEKHVDMLEDDITGPLYKTTVKATHYSVSKINEYLSAFVALIWLFLGLRSILSDLFQTNASIWFMSVLTIYFCIVIILKCRTKEESSKNNMVFKIRRHPLE